MGELRHAADRRFTFGTGKVGDLSGFAWALVALGIAVESIGRLFDPSPVAFGEATLVAILGLVVNMASVLLLSGGREHRHGHRHEHHHDRDRGHDHAHHDNNLRSAFAHVLPMS